MRTTCPKCNHALTIREVIQRSCSKCASRKRGSHAVETKPTDTSSIKTNFDSLVSEELKKRNLESAA
jgi:DNA-directed RNA polymerase subunit M/transcription elongation factor TFIIS